MRGRRVLGATVAAAVAAAGVAVAIRAAAPAHAQGAPAGTITVVGQGQVPITNLQGSFSVGVEHQAPTAQAALSGDNARMQKVIAALEAKGVPSGKLQTANLSVNPQYRQDPNIAGPGRIIGFDANDTLVVTVADPTQVGALIDAALAAGANNLGGVSFSATNPQQVEQQALTAAMADARAQAQALAGAAGLALGPATTITTQTQPVEPVYAAPVAMAAVGTGTPVLTGQQNYSEQVQVTFSTHAA